MKKKLFNILVLLISLIIFNACEKETEGISRTTYYADITLTGDQFSTVALNDTYTDPGFKTMEGSEDITSKTVVEGSVDTSKPGVYTITYSAKNKDGFSSEKNRYVGVIAPEAASMDISGVYQRNAGAQGFAFVRKTKYVGLYINNNPGGIALLPKPSTPPFSNEVLIYMFHTQASIISAPQQDSSVGLFSCDNGKYTPGQPAKYSWICHNAGYGAALRTFVYKFAIPQ